MTGFPDALELTATSLVVISPHPDDDVLGCGALIARMAPRVPVRVVYVTDGAASHRSISYPPLLRTTMLDNVPYAFAVENGRRLRQASVR